MASQEACWAGWTGLQRQLGVFLLWATRHPHIALTEASGASGDPGRPGPLAAALGPPLCQLPACLWPSSQPEGPCLAQSMAPA